MQITICGGGNGAHVLAGLISARQGLRVNVYAPLNDEAQRWRQGIEARGGIRLTRRDEALVGRPHRVSNNPAAVIPGSQLVLLSLPAFAHEIILRNIAPYLEDGVRVGALPARGAFDWCAREVLGGKKSSVILFGLQTLPWACRIREFGQEVTVLGTKTEVDLAAWPSKHAEEVAALLSDLLEVPMCPISSFLSLTLAGTGQLIHPGIMYGLFCDWDARPYAEAPLFYQGIDTRMADILERLSGEVQSLRALLEKRFPDLDLSAVLP
jgi:opine dehydrogenase